MGDIRDNARAVTFGVTGSRGFIGRALTARLDAIGAHVVRLEGDVRDAATYAPSFDVLIHLAASVPGRRDPDPAEIVSVNVAGTARALECCRQRNVPIVFASTAGVYSPTQVREPLTENAPVGPNWLYTLTKRMAEELCEHHGRVHGVSGAILRLFNVYGPDQPDHFIVPYLIANALSGQASEIRNPRSVRDFVYIDDVTRAIVLAALRYGTMRVFNVGTGVATTMTELSEILRGACGLADSKFNFAGRNDDATPNVYADITRISCELGWVPETALDQGLIECLKFSDTK